MAIAGITVQTLADAFAGVRERLASHRDVTAVEEGGPCLLAAVVETGAARLEDVLADMAAWDGVLVVGLASVNYEDDLDERGHIPCPPRKPRHGSGACFDGAGMAQVGEDEGGKA